MTRTLHHYTLSSLVVLTIAAAAHAQPLAATTWFPLERGNGWTLRDPMTGRDRTIECDDIWGAWSRVQGLIGSDLWVAYGTPTTSTLYVWDDAASGIAPLFRFGVTSLTGTWSFAVSGAPAGGVAGCASTPAHMAAAAAAAIPDRILNCPPRRHYHSELVRRRGQPREIGAACAIASNAWAPATRST